MKRYAGSAFVRPAVMREGYAIAGRQGRGVRVGAIVLAGAAVSLATWTTITSLAWVGRTFPGFMVMNNRVIASIALPGWSAGAVPDLYFSEVTAVDGVAVATGADVRERVAQLSPGAAVRYRLQRGALSRDVVVAAQRFEAGDWTLLFGAYLLNGIVFLGAGLLAWLLRPQAPLTRAFLAFGTASALFLFTAMDIYGPGTFFRLHMASEALVPAAAWHLALLFPQPHRLVRWRLAGYVLAAILVGAFQLELYDPVRFVQVLNVCMTWLAVMAFVFGARQISEYRQARAALARQRARAVTLGTLAGLALPGVIVAISLALGWGLGLNTITWTFLLFPVSLAYGIIAHDYFHIDAVVKRGGYYVALTTIVGLGYAAAVVVMDVGLHAARLTQSPAFPIVFSLIVLLLFNPLWTRTQALVDRIFFRTGYDGAALLAEVGTPLASALRREEITRLVHGCVARAFGEARTVLFFADETDGRLQAFGTGDTLPAPLAAALDGTRLVTAQDSVELHPTPAAHQAVQHALHAIEAEVIAPMRRQNRTVGALAIGPKRTGLFYTAGDADFLRALAQQATIAVHNAMSYEALITLNTQLEERVRERTAGLQAANHELSKAYADLQSAEVQLVQTAKLASLGRLAAGVAHEINNPLSFIASSLHPLRDWLDRARTAPPADAQKLLDRATEVVGIMEKGAKRTVDIVKDLRSFSRVNEAPRKRIDLREALEVSLRLLENRWRGRIDVHRACDDLPLVECEPGQMGQVFMNVLSNACDAIEDRGNLWIGAHQIDEKIEITVRDDGAGISPEHLDRVFDPFFTTKDVGEGTGLGLSIVHGIVMAHGGRIAAESTPGDGTTIRIVLPLHPPAAAIVPA